MITFFEDFLDHFRLAHSDIGKVIDGLNSEALDWVPGPEMNSITVLVVHLTGAERHWIGMAINDIPARDRDGEFRVSGLGADGLKARIVAADDFARLALDRLSLADLETVRRSPQNDRSITVGWCLAHALQHTALHMGHIQLTRQLWSLRNPPLKME